jgi:AcrR family transcriptional regulator
MEAAEPLVAQRGISQVSLREIIAAAGQRHKSAVHYYFGSKQRLLQEILDSGRLKPVIDRVLPLEQAAEAHRVVQSGVHFGKIVLRVPW